MKRSLTTLARPFSALLICTALWLSGCAAQQPVFSWYHPQGGEYLFAFDSSECETEVTRSGVALGADIQGPFFRCMHARGYALIDAEGMVVLRPEYDFEQQASAAR